MSTQKTVEYRATADIYTAAAGSVAAGGVISLPADDPEAAALVAAGKLVKMTQAEKAQAEKAE